ncbi:MAG: class I SAM-dependent methyltransferase [Chlorobiaceae bacterium]|nr:class I SAM-dependent methyltransferase [Chlorobiaceae bacterium]
MNSGQPFRTAIAPDWGSDAASRLRWERSLAFVRGSASVALPASGGLEIGDRTAMTTMLEAHFGCSFANTTVDLDTGAIRGCYPVVTAFEVIEHLYNPLHLLLEIRGVLDPAPSSRLFLSTPVWKPAILQSPEHFHEMPERAFSALLSRSGFSVVRRETFGIRSPLYCLRGIRPLLRCFFEKIRIVELAARD